MTSELLIETITMLKQRLEIRREYLARNESPTRQLLIDPLLDALGWDFEDSRRVALEFPIGQLRSDYVLIVDGRPKIVVEAKRFGTRLSGEPTKQVLRYANKASIRYALITDGAVWRMFDVFESRGPALHVVMDLDLIATDATDAAHILERMTYETIESERWFRIPLSV
ncbi:MAG: type I restriction endonuclease [Chloroflexi bacterium]|nr:type I restriction endonuclease [Chloroflexota bacterium]